MQHFPIIPIVKHESLSLLNEFVQFCVGFNPSRETRETANFFWRHHSHRSGFSLRGNFSRNKCCRPVALLVKTCLTLFGSHPSHLQSNIVSLLFLPPHREEPSRIAPM